MRLTGALFFRVEASSPWVVELPEARVYAPAIHPLADHLISYHIVTAGACWGGLIGDTPVRLEAGDILVFPHGDPYVMSMAPGMRGEAVVDSALSFFRMMAARQLPPVVREGGGGPEWLHLVCGFLGCDMRPFNPLLEALPRLIHVRRGNPADDPLSDLIALAVAESERQQPGSVCVMLRLGELMFIEAVRRYLQGLPTEDTGWLSALRDVNIGHALALLHSRPAETWTLEELAREVGLSRSAFADRFTQLVGHPPMQYLKRWRLQIAARLLTDGGTGVAAVARRVGYDSESSFSRAFKKAVGVPPATWRRQRELHATTALGQRNV